MKVLLLFSISIIILHCTTNETGYREIYIRDLGWKFKIPDSLNISDSAFDKDGKITAEVPANTAFATPYLDLFQIRHGEAVFKCHVMKDSMNAEDWKLELNDDARRYFADIGHSSKYKIIDTVLSSQKIAGVDFLQRYARLYDSDRRDTVSAYRLTGRVKGYELNINFAYGDDTPGNWYKQILESSEFGKSQ